MMTTILSKIAAAFVGLAMLVSGSIGTAVPTAQAPFSSVGAALPAATGVFETSLAAPITSTVSSMTLTANAVRGGGALSGYNCFTVDEGSSSAEIICGTVSGTAVTNMTRGISYSDGTTSITANKFAHRRGSNVKITDYPILEILKSQNNGEATFPNELKYDAGVAPTTVDSIADKGYVDGIAIAGSPDSTTSTKGIGKISVSPVSSTAPIFVGDNDTRVPTVNTSSLTSGQLLAMPGDNSDVAVGSGNKYVTQTGFQHNAEKYAVDTSSSTTAYVVTLSPAPTSLTVGMHVYAKIINSNTTTTTTLNVNGLGAKTIVKSVNTALAVGDIAANMFCDFVYDGTNFVMSVPTANSLLGLPSGTAVTTSSTATSGTVAVTGGSITITTSGNPVLVSFAGTGSSNANSGGGYMYLTIDSGSAILVAGTQNATGGPVNQSMGFSYLATGLSAGSHTFALSIVAQVGGSFTLAASNFSTIEL